MFLRALVAAGLLLAVACTPFSDPRHGELLVTADRLFDGERLLADGAVLIEGRTIVAAGRRGDLDVDADRTLALGNATLLPGFIDLHVHDFGSGMLAGGVTTVRDVGAPIAVMPPPRYEPGHLRILAAGPLMTVPGGYPGTVHDPRVGLPVRGPEAARAAVAMLVRRGAAVIKIALDGGGTRNWPLLSTDEVRAIVEEAHRRERIVTAHVYDTRGVRRALAGGVDEFAHAPCEVETELMRTAAARGIEVVATMHVLGCPGGLVNMRAFRRAGGVLLYGTDYPNEPIRTGIDVEELRQLTAAGLSRREAIAGATSRAGRQLGLAPLGTLAAGAPADVLGVRGDPFRRLDALKQIVFLSAGGFVVIEGTKVNLPVG